MRSKGVVALLAGILSLLIVGYLQQRNSGRGAAFFSGSSVSNISEIRLRGQRREVVLRDRESLTLLSTAPRLPMYQPAGTSIRAYVYQLDASLAPMGGFRFECQVYNNRRHIELERVNRWHGEVEDSTCLDLGTNIPTKLRAAIEFLLEQNPTASRWVDGELIDEEVNGGPASNAGSNR